jgi:hypothetical protein
MFKIAYLITGSFQVLVLLPPHRPIWYHCPKPARNSHQPQPMNWQGCIVRTSQFCKTQVGASTKGQNARWWGTVSYPTGIGDWISDTGHCAQCLWLWLKRVNLRQIDLITWTQLEPPESESEMFEAVTGGLTFPPGPRPGRQDKRASHYSWFSNLNL